MELRRNGVIGTPPTDQPSSRLSAFFCGFRAVCVLSAPYRTVFARRFGLFVDLLLTRWEDSKKPRGKAGRKLLM
jgi:hypothetical protein